MSGGKPSKGGPVLAKAVRRKRPTIGVYLIVKNEERVIEECLNSIVACGAFDEIIVVDTGSTDRTIEIIRGFPTVKLAFFEWCSSFSAARNYAFGLASEKIDWLFWMDADDTITPQSGAKMRESVLLAEAKTMGFLMQVRIPPPPGSHGSTIVDHCKIIRNVRTGKPGASRPKFQFSFRIHEQILNSIYEHGGAIERTEAYVTHSGYDYSPEGQLSKKRRDEPLLLADEAENESHPMPKWNLGMTHFYLRRFEEAIVKLEECLALAKPQDSIVHKAYAMLGGSCVELRDYERARSYFERGLALFPEDTELLFRMANFVRDMGDLEAAERFYVRLLSARRVSGTDSLDISMCGSKGLYNYAGVLAEWKRFNEAENCYKKALELEPDFLPALQALGRAYIEMRRFEDARAIQGRIAELNPAVADALKAAIEASQM